MRRSWTRADEEACLAIADYWEEAGKTEDGRAAALAQAERERKHPPIPEDDRTGVMSKEQAHEIAVTLDYLERQLDQLQADMSAAPLKSWWEALGKLARLAKRERDEYISEYDLDLAAVSREGAVLSYGEKFVEQQPHSCGLEGL